MPIGYVILREHRLLIATGSGRVTLAEFQAAISQALDDPDFDAEFNEITDLRAVSGIDLTGDEGRVLANTKLYSATSKRAVVAPSPAMFGMARLFATYHEMSKMPSHVRVFHNLPSALEWLGVKNSSELLASMAG